MVNMSNSTSNTVITGTSDADILINFGDNVTIDGGAGNDNLQNSGTNVSIAAGAGDDYIFNIPSSNVSIDGGDGDDDIFSNGSNTYVVGGNGADSIKSSGDLVKIHGLAGNDTIRNYGDSITIDGGMDADYIENNGGKNVLISGGKGNDTISIPNEFCDMPNGEMSHDEEPPSLDDLDVAQPVEALSSSTTGDYALSSGSDNEKIINPISKITINGGDDDDRIEIGSEGIRLGQQYGLLKFNRSDFCRRRQRQRLHQRIC